MIVGYYVVSLTSGSLSIREIVTFCPPFISKREAKLFMKDQMKRGIRTKLYLLKAELTK